MQRRASARNIMKGPMSPSSGDHFGNQGGYGVHSRSVHEDGEDDYDNNAELDMQPIEVKRTPDDQIQGLAEEQLNEVFTKVITATNPNVSKAVTRFNYQEGQFKLVPTVSHLAVHFDMEGWLIHADSDEAREQAEYIAAITEVERKHAGTGMDPIFAGVVTGNDEGGGPASARGPGPAAAAADEEDDEDDGDVPDDHALKNQFNFSERASQTFNNALRDREVSTEPPPTTEFSGNVTAWDIFDAYVEDLTKQQEAARAKDKPTKKASDDEKDSAPQPFSTANANSASGADQADARASDLLASHSGLALAIRTMERMVNQNSEADLFHDFKYFEDKHEAKRADANDKRGSFLPLWKFNYELAKRKTVTAITWNPKYSDLFAVGYGSYDFMKQSTTNGLICCYSLKNTAFPEYKFTTDAGVMCLDFHPVHSSLLVAGLYDGTVCVFDVRSKSNDPIYVSNDPKVKHTDPVWQVRWQREEEAGKGLSFFSISSDGRVTNWLLNKNELNHEEVIELKLMSGTKDHEEIPDHAMVGLAGGVCFDFNPVSEHLFIVGTEEGAIQSYSKAYNSQFLRAFEGHHMAVYSIRWNPFHPHVFLTASADWTVKLWEINTSKPIMVFDLNCSVGDIAWAPYSSTVFSVVTSDGKVRIYDLHVNKHEAIGETRVNKKSKLTHVAFNPKEPILCVGDDRGVVNILKLSANLRKTTAPTLDELDVEEEIEKLDRLLIITDKEVPLFPMPSPTSNLMPKKKDPAAAAANLAVKTPKSPSNAGGAAGAGSKPGTAPNTARNADKKKMDE